MERRISNEEKTKAKQLDRRHNHRTETGPSGSPAGQSSSCGYKAAEFLCSACLLCVCCPLAVVWCCIKLPCKLGWRAVKRAGNWACCRSDKRNFADYSSFSDIDSDSLPTAKVQHWDSRNVGSKLDFDS